VQSRRKQGRRNHSRATAHGNKYEAVALYKKRHNKKVLHFGLLDSLNDNEEFLAGSPDGITSCGRLIEVSLDAQAKRTGSAPLRILDPVSRAYSASGLLRLHRVRPFARTRCFKYDPDFFLPLIPQLRSFWEEVTDRRGMIERGELVVETTQEEAHLCRSNPYDEAFDKKILKNLVLVISSRTVRSTPLIAVFS